ISMGDFEPVRALLGEHGGTIGTVEMQPGGPQAHGSIRGLPILAFPGNPVSAQVSYALFLSPLLRAWAGLPPAVRRRLALAEPVAVPPGRRRFLRARLDERGAVVPIGGTGSHLVTAMAAADVLIDLPPQFGDLPAGALVDTVEL
ncbi:molybdopterin molybdenumtransferase MoeA, partial [Schumannella luteola]